MDWNIFFSSLAQSVGGLVGIFAAFIITKIVNNQTEFERNKNKVRELIDISGSLKDQADLLYFRWFCEEQLALILYYELGPEIRKGIQKTPEEYYNNWDFPAYFPRAIILKAIEGKIQEPDKHEFSQMTPNAIAEHRKEVLKEGGKIESLRVEATHQTRKLTAILSEIKSNSEFFSLVSISIILALILFFLGLIYPLSFLPLNQGEEIAPAWDAFLPLLLSFKGLMLIIPSVIFSAIMIFFFFTNVGLVFSQKDMDELAKAAQLGYYSHYFDERLRNKKEQSDWLKEQEDKKKL